MTIHVSSAATRTITPTTSGAPTSPPRPNATPGLNTRRRDTPSPRSISRPPSR